MASDQLFIDKKYATIRRTEKENCTKHGVRLYRESPSGACLQIRSSTPKQGIFANVVLNAEECRVLSDELLRIAAELRNDPGTG
jgi:hypothetical protein